jgi:hypothetical protein
MGKKELNKTIAVLLLSYCTLLTAFAFFGSYYARVLFPLFRWEIGLLSSNVEVRSIGFEDYEDQELITVKVTITVSRSSRSWFCRLPPINLYIHPIIIFSILSAWPRISLKDRLKLFAISLPLLLILEIVDMPLLVLSRIMARVHALLAGDGGPLPSIHSYWLSFLSNGGREFLSVCVALFSLGMFYLSKVRVNSERERNAPCPCGSGRKYKNCCATPGRS